MHKGFQCRSPKISLADIGDYVRKGLSKHKAGFLHQMRHLTHYSGVRNHRIDDQLVVSFSFHGVVTAEGDRCIVAIKNSDLAAEPDNARHLSKDRGRIFDVTDERMSDDGVERTVGQTQTMGISRSKLDDVSNTLLLAKAPGSGNEIRAHIQSSDTTSEAFSASNGARCYSSAAAEVKDTSTGIDVHGIEIFAHHLHEAWMLSARLKPRDHHVQRGIV